MKKVNVYVTLRESVLDPQGVAVKGGLEHLGFAGVESVRIGKVIELQVADETTEAMVRDMCEKLLVNTVIENYRIEMGVLA
ncbi:MULTISPECIES: phosphoribosylformylglycinamidine synthase subunit PurS [unclassified Exiguobacterium]|jgi:phosphoribosylformylglycinamidine synthase|uniref:phosphoribosylformylglycinamidine synthase subunit PurS n=1 Tax=unclassified Exiguobacterium TaxID=2644629 RepID=UPI000354416B|nr:MULTISPECIES: phosphoribosylformylglycinamidine synthase subunit PurS [unclassified Exiguobacterium]EPE62094.1 phosphoribosylformylglycinamidine synthase, purS protein [Exiguobacterium sp. S17]KGI84330.1 phosphoribosylformylglycinamidine synthase [Exiguobacterium mexicanum]TCI35192.1 phosphoribosylformylglycinamidine synthase subunit PurS [Exiguobacterium sp. SH4S7]TCI53404.1 phosphoribosylformylglycinamidine synthase subunit PurS [Exiguobacterium sp. SH1S21]TCI59888.1 phosphoribosylformylg